jgi:ArsR family transcriptional regulator, arsenate/arsenite/antimonite-responsive transcriptional repressor
MRVFVLTFYGYLVILPIDIITKGQSVEKKRLARFEGKAIVIKAMAHPTRIMIIEELAKREHCVGELTEMVGADTSTVSKHLAILRNAGIVADEKRNQMVYYTLIMPCTLNFLSCLETVLQKRAKAQFALMK